MRLLFARDYIEVYFVLHQSSVNLVTVIMCMLHIMHTIVTHIVARQNNIPVASFFSILVLTNFILVSIRAKGKMAYACLS